MERQRVIQLGLQEACLRYPQGLHPLRPCLILPRMIHRHPHLQRREGQERTLRPRRHHPLGDLGPDRQHSRKGRMAQN